jgi:phosphoglycerol transferase MdoB-like AlkP superfamily enzyme
MKEAIKRAREIFLYSDSEPNEVLIGILHMLILPFAMLEIGTPWILLQIVAHLVGAFQLFAVLFNGGLKLRKSATMLATLVAIATCANYTMAGMMRGSHLGWLLIMIFAIWNLIRVTTEDIKRQAHAS